MFIEGIFCLQHMIVGGTFISFLCPVAYIWIDDLIKVVGIHWMWVAHDQSLWRSLEEAYVQQWTCSG